MQHNKRDAQIILTPEQRKNRKEMVKGSKKRQMSRMRKIKGLRYSSGVKEQFSSISKLQSIRFKAKQPNLKNVSIKVAGWGGREHGKEVDAGGGTGASTQYAKTHI